MLFTSSPNRGLDDTAFGLVPSFIVLFFMVEGILHHLEKVCVCVCVKKYIFADESTHLYIDV